MRRYIALILALLLIPGAAFAEGTSHGCERHHGGPRGDEVIV